MTTDPIARYVVGVDGSRPAAAALHWVLARFRSEPLPIVVVHVVDDDGAMGEEFHQEEARRGATLLADALAEIQAEQPGAVATSLQLQGMVAWELARHSLAGDLLVIGTHKTGYLHGRALGSRSVQIAAAAPCSVAVIPEVELRFRLGVVAGLDRAQTAPLVARMAGREAARRDQELTLIECVMPGAHSTGALDAGVAAARAECPAVPIRSRIVQRPAAEALLDVSRNSALLVLGPGSLDATRNPIGSVLHDVLMNTSAPVLIARPADSQELVGPITVRTHR